MSSDEEIIETADRWREQDRQDRATHRDRVWSFFRTCFVIVLIVAVVWSCLAALKAIPNGHERERAAEAKARLQLSRENAQRKWDERAAKAQQVDAKRKRVKAQDLAWVDCVNAIGIDSCTLVVDRGREECSP